MARVHQKTGFGTSLPILILLLVAWLGNGVGQGEFELLTGNVFDAAVPKDFYLEGNAIPTERRNAALLKTPAAPRVLFALLDTSGYSSQVKEKYIGMVVVEGNVSICGRPVGVGSYGFGLDKPPSTSSRDAKFFLYNQAGTELAQCAAKKDLQLKLPRPLQVVLGSGKAETARLYLGRYWLELQ